MAYPGGYPDFESAGLVKFKANVEQIPDHRKDYQEANKQLGRDYDVDTERWHNHEDGKQMLLIDNELHARFTHKGGVANGS